MSPFCERYEAVRTIRETKAWKGGSRSSRPWTNFYAVRAGVPDRSMLHRCTVSHGSTEGYGPFSLAQTGHVRTLQSWFLCPGIYLDEEPFEIREPSRGRKQQPFWKGEVSSLTAIYMFKETRNRAESFAVGSFFANVPKDSELLWQTAVANFGSLTQILKLT